MKIEYLPDGSPDCPLIRIYDDDAGEFASLHAAVRRLADGFADRLDLSDLPGFAGIDGCALVIAVGGAPQGVRRIAAGRFEWTLPRERWDDVTAFIEPFAEPSVAGSHQWLAGPEAGFGLEKSKIAVLITDRSDGTW